MSPVSPITGDVGLVSISILAEGAELSETMKVLSIYVRKQVNKIAFARIEMMDGSAAAEDFTLSDSDKLKPGTIIEIKAGYEQKNHTIFKGIILKQQLQSNRSKGPSLSLECYDAAYQTTLGRFNRYFSIKTDSDAIATVLGNYSLTTQIDSTSQQHKELIQYYASDWDFILSRAEAAGLIVLVGDGKFSVVKPKPTASPALEVTYGYDIYRINLELDGRYQYHKVNAHAWDPSTQKMIKAAAQNPAVNEQGNLSSSNLSADLGFNTIDLTSSASLEQGELQNWADANLLKAWMSRIQGTITFQGSELAKIGDTIKIAGLGNRFNGTGFISGVAHDIREGLWETEVTLGLSAGWFSTEPDIVAPPTSGLLPGTNGLQIGTVQKINEDPDGDTRILVDLALVEDDQTGVWARLAANYATQNAGTFFIPEVGDEVVLGFMNEDPRYPVILGMLYSAKHSPPYTPDESNSIKAFVSKNQLKWEFNDEKKIITIETPGGNKMIFSDEDKSILITDQNSNKIEMNAGGITMQSPKDISIKATGKVSVEGTAGVTIQSSADVETSGLNVKNSAEMEFSAAGNLSSKLTSALEVTVQGTIVKIN